jgi:hypothetical protein
MRGAALVACALLVSSCESGRNKIAERVSCYPACLADIVQLCPMVSDCEMAEGTNAQLPNADVRNGVAACFASGEKRWQATNATSADHYIVVKHASGAECYTAISQGAAMRYTITVGGQTVAELDAEAQPAPTVTCRGVTTPVTVNADCFALPWTTKTCGAGPCDFGALPAGAATDTTN